jgi:hypothetical protein
MRQGLSRRQARFLVLPESCRGVSEPHGYPTEYFAASECPCGSRRFRLYLDDTERVADRICTACGAEHPTGDSAEYLVNAELGGCECPCGGDSFEISVGVSLYDGGEVVRWFYLSCRCPACELTTWYGDWKIGGGAYRDVLGRV